MDAENGGPRRAQRSIRPAPLTRKQIAPKRQNISRYLEQSRRPPEAARVSRPLPPEDLSPADLEAGSLRRLRADGGAPRGRGDLEDFGARRCENDLAFMVA